MSQYPVVPGHEIVGTVAAVGSAVTRLQVGQRVGVGALCGSCMQCEWCEGGAQHVCPQIVGTVIGEHKGGFASVVRVNNWQFAHPLPGTIASEHAGPLMCAGTTVFTPLIRYGVRPTDRVAVVGIGGLGHLAVQYLAKWGCEVTAISSTHDKDEMAHGFGATRFIATRGTNEMQKAVRSFDFILSTVSADLPGTNTCRLSGHRESCASWASPKSQSQWFPGILLQGKSPSLAASRDRSRRLSKCWHSQQDTV